MLKSKTKSRDIDESQLSHTKYNCLYHIVFIPKYRRKAIYGKLRRDIGIILRRLCEYKEVEIIEAHACVDHIHMLLTVGFNQKYNNSTVLSVTQDKASITRVVKQFKGAVSKEVGFSVWQKSFYDHIVRSEKDLAKMWQYIKSNPLLWEDDCFRKIR